MAYEIIFAWVDCLLPGQLSRPSGAKDSNFDKRQRNVFAEANMRRKEERALAAQLKKAEEMENETLKRQEELLMSRRGLISEFQVLGIAIDAGIDDIKVAYRKLAFKYHPDRNKSEDAAEKIKEINSAYSKIIDVLS